MKDKITHNKKDEWGYTTTATSARKKAKRARSKAKRTIIKRILKSGDIIS